MAYADVAQPMSPPAGQAAIAPGEEPARKAEDLSRKRRWFRAFEQNKERELAEAQTARRYYHAKQWSEAELKKLRARGQPPIFDNRIARKVDFLVGVEQRMRRDPKAYPTTPNHEQDADLSTAALRFVCDANRWQALASDVTHDGLVSGIGVIWIGVEPGKAGLDVKLKPVAVDRFFYDPRSERHDFSDARYMGLHLWLDVDEAKDRYPDKADALESMVDRDTGARGSMTFEQDREEQWGDFEQRRVRIIEYWERRIYRGDMMQSTAMTPVRSVLAWYYCFFSGDLELESGLSPYLDHDGVPDCPYVAWSPYVDERGDRYGPIRNMQPMQDEINHRRSKLLHMLNVRQIYVRDAGATDDVDKLRSELARPDGVVETHGGKWGEDIGIVDTSQQIKGQAELLAQAQSSLENLGPNPGLVGKGGGVADQSGRAILAQRDSGMIELSPVFERLRDWKLRCYRKIWGRVKTAWTEERWIRLTDTDDGVPSFLGVNTYDLDPMTGQIVVNNQIADLDVDIILEEGPDTITMQEELLQTLSQIGAAAAGPLGRIIIELSNTPNKDRLLKMLAEAQAPTPEAAATQQRVADLEADMAMAKVADTRASAEKKRAETVKTMAEAMVAPAAMPQLFPVPYADMMAQPMGQPMPADDMGMDPGMVDMPPEMMQPQGGAPLENVMPIQAPI